MFLDAVGTPKEVTPENLHEYSYDLHAIMLLNEVYIPPRWHGTIYSTADILDTYQKRFEPDCTSLTFHALEPNEPELICCERSVVEITVLPAGLTLHSGTTIVVFLLKLKDVNMLVTKELGTQLNFFPGNHYHLGRIVTEGIDELYLDDKMCEVDSPCVQFHAVYSLIRKLQPLAVKSLSGKPLPEHINQMCHKVDHNSANK